MTLSEEQYAHDEDSELLVQIKTKNWSRVKSMLASTEGKKMSAQKDVYGNLPIHAAIGYQAPEDVSLALIEAYPEAAGVHGTDYWLPLHVAAMYGCSPAVMEALIRAYPQGLDDEGEPNIKGRTPRHFSARFKHNTALLERPTEEWIKLVDEGK
mmetsp:Transcript_13092/g.28398  ORF Transcript_13092/g.28398 Transcript_13092/m.28398 type:complete len:154 (-) Transcript_13092:184-645(-)